MVRPRCLAIACASVVLAVSSVADGAPQSNSPLRVGEADFGKTIEVRVGDTISVTLRSDYHPPSTSDAGRLRGAASGGFPTNTAATATFTAVNAGPADISSTTDYGCLHTKPACKIAQRLWVMHVVVRP